MASNLSITIPAERIERRILLVRRQKVLLDFQLAELYEVGTKALNQAVKRNLDRFPEDFMFQLSEEEMDLVSRSQIVTLDSKNRSQSVTGSSASASGSTKARPGNRSQIVTGSQRHRDPKSPPYAFTEQGVAMLSSVLRSPRAVLVNIAIMRTFVQLRQMLATNSDLARKLEALEQKYDAQFKVVFDAIRELMRRTDPPSKPVERREIGFHTNLPERGTKPRSQTKAKISA